MITNRFRQTFKNAFIPLILFAGVLGVSVFISCSNPDPELPPPGGNEAKQYCVYVQAEKCFPGPYTTCPGDGLPTDICPFEVGETRSYEYCVYMGAETCFKGPYTACPGDGLLADECPPFVSSGDGTSSSAAGGGDDLPEYAYCVYSTEAMCLNGPFIYCIANGVLSNECPFPKGGASSSSASDGSVSSSSAVGVVSSSSAGVVSSSSVVIVVSSSSVGGGVIGGNGGPVSYYGKLQASGNRLVGSKTGAATPVQVRGVSLGWSNTGWESAAFFNATTVNAMVDDWKAEIIRVPYGENDASNKARIKTAIDAAIAKDVYVIIDYHSHNAHNETAAAKTFFSEMAQTYGSTDHVIFEIYNEPVCSNGASSCTAAQRTTWTQIKTYASEIITEIRKSSTNLILVGTPSWDQDINVAASGPISDINVAYVFHFYAYTHPLSDFQSKLNTTLNASLPVFVSEYGTTHADGGGGTNYNTHSAANTNAWHTFMDNNKISSCAWNVNDKYEGSAFFGTSSTGRFTQSAANFSNTSMMTASGQYIFNKLRTYAETAAWRSGSNPGTSSSGGGTPSSSSGGNVLYCDFGVFNSYGGGCYIISSASECDAEYGTVRNSCPRKQYCDFGPVTSYGGGCFEIEDANDCDLEYGTLTNSCGSNGFNGGGNWCVDHDFYDCANYPEVLVSSEACASLWGGVLAGSCPAGYERYP